MSDNTSYIFHKEDSGIIYLGDVLDVLKSLNPGIVQTCITSPPYWGLRDYGEDGQLGLEKTPEEYIEKMVAVFREVRRVLRDDGTLWLNMGDSYSTSPAGNKVDKSFLGNSVSGRYKTDNYRRDLPKDFGNLKPKDLCGMPWRLALALQADGWYLRSDIIWHKPNPIPESVTDRPTKSHEYIFLLTKKPKYFYDAEAVSEKTVTFDNSIRDRDNTKLNNTPGRTKMSGLKENNYQTRNLRDVWTINTASCSFTHFATFPTLLVDKCIMAGSKLKSIVIDPFGGTGTVALRAKELGRRFIHIDLSEKYNAYAKQRLAQEELNL